MRDFDGKTCLECAWAGRFNPSPEPDTPGNVAYCRRGAFWGYHVYSVVHESTSACPGFVPKAEDGA
jgi:hypothetical protein